MEQKKNFEMLPFPLFKLDWENPRDVLLSEFARVGKFPLTNSAGVPSSNASAKSKEKTNNNKIQKAVTSTSSATELFFVN